ncbi:hypothetical protein J31TS6_15180 [Brevibacillus reuszeri]|nr:hypothetical protein J31TS6_15180 [Brevibacillus reuszeri]
MNAEVIARMIAYAMLYEAICEKKHKPRKKCDNIITFPLILSGADLICKGFLPIPPNFTCFFSIGKIRYNGA